MTTAVTIALYLAFAMWRAYRDRKCEQAHETTNRAGSAAATSGSYIFCRKFI